MVVKKVTPAVAAKSWLENFERENSNKAVGNKSISLKYYVKAIERYMRQSTLHGLRYIGDPTITYGERFFWLIAFLFATGGAAYFISNIYIKYNINPVIVTTNPNPTPANEIPFPAVTICNMNYVRKSEAEIIIRNGSVADKNFLDIICAFDDKKPTIEGIDNETASWESFANFLSKVGQPCSKLLRVCKWLISEVDCNDLFTMVLTDEGLCCNFNQLPIEYILRNPQVSSSSLHNFELDLSLFSLWLLSH